MITWVPVKSSETSKPNNLRKSTIETTPPRTFITPFKYGREFGIGVIVSNSKTSFTYLTGSENISSFKLNEKNDSVEK